MSSPFRHHRQVAALGFPFLQQMTAAAQRHATEFGAITAREDHPGGAHGATQSVFLRTPPWPLGPHSQEDLRLVDWPALQADPALRALLDALHVVTGLRPARALLVSLAPGGEVAAHRDEGAYAEATERFHFPIITGPEAVSQIEDEQCSMIAGTLWWFNKAGMHSARNGTSRPRVHLILDGWRV
ncbi:aspartyl/asparaginyl beta-hydroxylase domain-containing protein [Roseomonas sp. E05]|uniref:aspartyl/asparaginyl beta-hydroxylase domain-containing protein n=1 Tax=Roseomonas sp. E05 TaxID=3046310 RepID=UPI0024B87DC1|nr:aspartyl/asparaginyl beta-hydroxylase domain-containing protein [Roseomonas sp. E05]MDJ0391372.1 aspartyl/asparaginyl beta-hydroxylase domain-containing protein [Roseomonas sp. E05]